MDERINSILQKEEEKYYPLLKEAIASSKRYPINSKACQTRIVDELEIIHHQRFSKAVWYCHLLSKEARSHKEPFYLKGTPADLYVLYILEVLKNSPLANRCCYQACLGTKEHPRAAFWFEMSFRKSFVNHIMDFAKKIDQDTTSYHYSFHINEDPVTYEPGSMFVLSNSVPVSDYFVAKEQSGSDMKIIGEKEECSFNAGILFDIVVSPFLSLLYALEEKFGAVSIKKAFPNYLSIGKDNDFNSDYFVKLFSHFKIEKYEDAISQEAMVRSSHAIENIKTYVFSDRESVFDFFTRFLGAPKNDAYYFMEKIRKGAFRNEFFDDDFFTEIMRERELNDLNNIKYLLSRGHAAEIAYIRVKLAYYYVNHKEEYLSLKKHYE